MKARQALQTLLFLCSVAGWRASTVARARAYQGDSGTPIDWSCPGIIDGVISANSDTQWESMEKIHATMLRCENVRELRIVANLTSKSLDTAQIRLPFNATNSEKRYKSAPEVLILHEYNSDALIAAPETETQYYPTLETPCGTPLEPDSRFGDSHKGTVGSVVLEEAIQVTEMGQMTEIGGQKVLKGDSDRSEDTLTKGSTETYGPSTVETTQALNNFDMWLQIMDFSRIHTLKLSGDKHPPLTINVARKLPRHLKSLHTVDLKGSPIAVVQTFLTSLPRNHTLKHLTWRDPWAAEDLNNRYNSNGLSPLNLILQHQGANLESFHFRTVETSDSDTPTLSLPQIEEFVHLAPNLRALTIDLLRTPEGTWPWNELQLLATRLPMLTDLTIYFQLHAHEPPPPGPETITGCYLGKYQPIWRDPPGPKKPCKSIPPRPAPTEWWEGSTTITSHLSPLPAPTRTTQPEAEPEPEPCQGHCVGPDRYADPIVRLINSTPDKKNPKVGTKTSLSDSTGAEAMASFLWKHRTALIQRLKPTLENMSICPSGPASTIFKQPETPAATPVPFNLIRIRSGKGWKDDMPDFLERFKWDPFSWKSTFRVGDWHEQKQNWMYGKRTWITCHRLRKPRPPPPPPPYCGFDMLTRFSFPDEWTEWDEEKDWPGEAGQGGDPGDDSEFSCRGRVDLDELKEWEARCNQPGSGDNDNLR
ncbi:hypothetical protein V8F20_001823 [Naviculisporaceae sp. PSN 640]